MKDLMGQAEGETKMGTKNDPGKFNCYESDEPIFVLKAKDPTAAFTIRSWIAYRPVSGQEVLMPPTCS